MMPQRTPKPERPRRAPASPSTAKAPAAGRPTRDQKKAATRARLLDAAAVVFARKGLGAATLEDIAWEAGLTKGAVYSNFESKEELIHALLDERLEGPMLEILDSVPRGVTHEEESRTASEMMAGIYARERDALLLGVEYTVYLARNPALRERVPSRYTERRDAIAREIEARAHEHGETLPLPAEDLAIGLSALGQGIALERLVAPDRVPEDLFERLLGVIFRTPPAEAPAPRPPR